MKKNIILVGILGCGKSSLGKKLAKRLSMEYVDMDAVIEEEAQMTITDMFARFGEPYFRDKETELCRRLARRHGLVISTGGGVVQRPENMEALKETGLVVFVDRSPWTIIETIDVSNRPLLRENPQRLFELYARRLPLYRKYADVIFKNRGSLRQAAVTLMRELSSYPPFEICAGQRHPSIAGRRVYRKR